MVVGPLDGCLIDCHSPEAIPAGSATCHETAVDSANHEPAASGVEHCAHPHDAGSLAEVRATRAADADAVVSLPPVTAQPSLARSPVILLTIPVGIASLTSIRTPLRV